MNIVMKRDWNRNFIFICTPTLNAFTIHRVPVSQNSYWVPLTPLTLCIYNTQSANGAHLILGAVFAAVFMHLQYTECKWRPSFTGCCFYRCLYALTRHRVWMSPTLWNERIEIQKKEAEKGKQMLWWRWSKMSSRISFALVTFYRFMTYI